MAIIGQCFETIKHYDQKPSQKNSSSLPFTKTKKKRFAEYQPVSKTQRLASSVNIVSLIDKKIHIQVNHFWLLFRQHYALKKKQESQSKEESDGAELMSEVVRHMVFLAGMAASKERGKSDKSQGRLRDLKLKYWLLKSKLK